GGARNPGCQGSDDEPGVRHEPVGRRPYRYLAVPPGERDRPHLVRELVKCGKPTCGCARDPRRRHGPYIYFRWERCDAASGGVVYCRESVALREVVRVRRWIRRHRGEAAQSRGVLTWLRRVVACEAKRGS